jgi:hypothetical protein
MITSQHGNEIEIKTAFYATSGEYVGAECLRKRDREIRYYSIEQMKATGGIEELYSALDAAPDKESEGSTL